MCDSEAGHRPGERFGRSTLRPRPPESGPCPPASDRRRTDAEVDAEPRSAAHGADQLAGADEVGADGGGPDRAARGRWWPGPPAWTAGVRRRGRRGRRRPRPRAARTGRGSRVRPPEIHGSGSPPSNTTSTAAPVRAWSSFSASIRRVRCSLSGWPGPRRWRCCSRRPTAAMWPPARGTRRPRRRRRARRRGAAPAVACPPRPAPARRAGGAEAGRGVRRRLDAGPESPETR